MGSLLTFDARKEIRFAWKWLRVFQLPNKLALLCAMLAAVFVVAGPTLPAAAHGIHEHITAVGAPAFGGASAGGLAKDSLDHSMKMQVGTAEPDAPDDGAGQPRGGACCCGSVACHAGVTLVMPFVAPPLQPGARVEPSLSSSWPQTVPMGLERPPRGLASA